MKRTNTWKVILMAILVVAAVWQLIPTFKLQGLSEQEKAEMPREALNRLYTKAIHLGLDLKGGMHMVLEINHKGLAKALGRDVTELKEKELSDATDRALEIIRNRVDQYGVAEPLIQKQGADRIVVQLPGVDRERARGLIGTTALLEFKLVQEDKATQEAIDRIDKALAGKAEAKLLDSTLTGDKPFSMLLSALGNEMAVVDLDRELVEKALKNPEVAAVIPAEYEFAWGEKVDREGFRGYKLYLLKKQAELTGAALADARMGVGTNDNPGGLYVDFTLVRKAAGNFSRVTAANIKRQLAIVLDGAVVSAPVIQDRIPNGKGQITMGSATSSDEARDLAIILRAGALPAPVDMIEERSVGPTLGQDSINNGVKATIIGGIAVVLFIIIYYSLAGLIATVALMFNMVMLLAIMAAFRFTMTLPGIAGIALTVGMAVDTYVLIFERIREELVTGKTVRAAIEAGYERAFRTILDSNATVFFAAVALLVFGTGPVKGFAVSLIIGLLVSMYTAVVVTRMIFDWITIRWNITKLYI
ncbi:MAG: protein translocase subunit SecD [Candidatus Edwardsbacteria bacterium]|nr:protein translocase subunit SecD [Candidatus Edwardsbacteria bacterium]